MGVKNTQQMNSAMQVCMFVYMTMWMKVYKNKAIMEI